MPLSTLKSSLGQYYPKYPLSRLMTCGPYMSSYSSNRGGWTPPWTITVSGLRRGRPVELLGAAAVDRGGSSLAAVCRQGRAMHGDGSREHGYLDWRVALGMGRRPPESWSRPQATEAGATPAAARGTPGHDPSLHVSEQGRTQARVPPATHRLGRSHTLESDPAPSTGRRNQGRSTGAPSFLWLEGKIVHTQMRYPLIHSNMSASEPEMYIMAYL
jgi:hypothetical protein